MRRARNRLSISEQQLSERLTRIGHPIARPTINQIENGQRSVALAEVLVLAEALEIPPGELVFNPSLRKVEVLPGNFEMSGDEAVEWLAGYLPIKQPGQSRAQWLENAGENHTDEEATEWTVLGRYERRLYQVIRELEQAQRLLLNARDKTERAHRANNINYITKRAKGMLAYMNRQLRIIHETNPDYTFDDETLALIQRIEDLPNLTVP
ncbi:MAG: helix-turn-helix transcriptional regulator [Propionibacteriaceae bacterium]|nr:helix-turn-helix transcriptional regulator [Propionibacteriaceae bacterium]